MLAHTTPEDFIRSVDQAKLERRRQRDAEMALETRPLLRGNVIARSSTSAIAAGRG